MRLMFLSDKLLGGTSAYSKVGNETCKRLAKLGHKVAHIPMGYANRMGIITAEEGVQIYPSGANPFSEDVAIEDYLNFKADMLITIKEPWVFNHIFYQPINFVPMAIIDHSPVSTEITSKLNTAFKVIAVSRFGQMELKRAEIDSYYIPHGVNTSIYKPYPEKKEEYRKLWYLDPDAYTIGIVAMNRSRKLISRMLRGYKRFREMNPNVNSQMLLWTDIIPMDMPEDPQMGVADVGVNLLPEILQLGLNEHVIWPHRDLIRHGLPEWSGEGGKWDMVKLYNCMDVLLHCTGGEGFALPLIEAQACGVVPITTDYAAAPEQVGAGLVVPYSDYVILNTPGTRYALADIDKMAEALTKIHNVDREKLARKARAFALRYDWNNIVEQYWKPFLSKCEEELRPLITKEGIKPWD
jgi:glycosyltransferase involved in cell wall biosynthesis